MPTPGHAQTAATDYRYPIGLFQRLGVELEYMIVDAKTLDVMPVCDRVMQAVTGEPVGDATPDIPAAPDGTLVSWCNELTLHVLEMRPEEPAYSLEALADLFPRHVALANRFLEPMGAVLLPTAMHPWMDPEREMRLWPHAYGPVYAALDRIFSCKGHGWANLQSTHINLPFAGDDDFGRLHAAIRLILPFVSGLAASSPIADGRVTGLADTRLEVYRNHGNAIPSMVAKVIPEPVYSRAAYEGELLAGLYRDIAPHDPERILQHEWLNARGAIARFDRGAIEIRVIDVQECPDADCAVSALVIETVRALVNERWTSTHDQRALAVDPLHGLLLAGIRDAERTVITHAPLLRQFGVSAESMTSGELWRHLAEALIPEGSRWWPALRVILDRGTVSTRLVRSLSKSPSRAELHGAYRELASCLAENRQYGAQ